MRQLHTDIDISVATSVELFINALIRTFNHYSLAVGLSGLLILGIRNVRNSGITIRSVLMPSIGFFLILFFAVLHFSSFPVLQRSSQLLESIPYYGDNLSKLEKIMASEDVKPDTKASISKIYAQTRYRYEGLIIDFFTTEGTVETYKPTEKEVAERNDMLKSEVEAIVWNNLARRSMWGTLIFWTLLVIFSILIGIFSSVGETKHHG